MGVFITIVFAVITLYLIYLGVMRGAFPVLVALVVSGLAFMVAIDFAPQLARKLAGTLSNWSADDLLAVSYTGLFIVFFLIFGFLALRFGPEIAPMYPNLDKMFGVVLGLLAGIVLTGALASGIFGFTRMQSFRERHRATDKDLWIKPHNYLLRGYGYVRSGIAGKRDFNPETALAGTGVESPAMPFGGDGFWVSSVPKGRRLFISTDRGIPLSDFTRSLQGWVETDWSKGPIKFGQERMRGFAGNTAQFIPTTAMSMWVAVEMDVTEGYPAGEENPFISDGQQSVYRYERNGRRYAVKIYEIWKKGRDPQLVTHIPLLLPRNPSQQDIEKAIPDKASFRFENQSSAEGELRGAGLDDETIARIIDWAKRAGKVPFRDSGNNWRAIEILSAVGDYQVINLTE